MTDGTSRAAAIDEAERVLQEEHDRLLTVVRQCADAVAAKWDGDSVSDRDRVVPPFGRALDGSGALSRLPRALANAVTATGRPMAAPPVAGPPYVVVTGEGVVLRATVGDERLVILLRTFEVDGAGDEDERSDEASDAGDETCDDGDEISTGNSNEHSRYRRIDGISLEIEIR